MQKRDSKKGLATLCIGGGVPLYDHCYPTDHRKNIANPGKVIEWDSATQTIKNGGEANALLKRAAYRQGWEYSADKI